MCFGTQGSEKEGKGVSFCCLMRQSIKKVEVQSSCTYHPVRSSVDFRACSGLKKNDLNRLFCRVRQGI